MKNTQKNSLTAVNYDRVEQQFITMLEIEELDKKVAVEPELGTLKRRSLPLYQQLTSAALGMMQHIFFYNGCFIA